ncbi:MAG: hypothetical protein IT364_18480, partial [Candidatus Hydrogenedentes bacterium]|nr:hypothetical protein [Candidatus Hydrogenedentota bacterium]
MAILVYLTQRCKDDADRYALNADLERFQARLETAQSTNLFDPFPPPYIVKKKFGGRQGRLIAEQHFIAEHAVIVFLAILIRGDHDYENEFGKDPIKYGERHFREILQPGELERFVQERTRKDPPTPKPAPSNSEYEFLYSAFAHHGNQTGDELVCETREWIECISDPRIQPQLVRFNKPCCDALGMATGIHRIPLMDKDGWFVLVRRLENALLLLRPFTGDDPALEKQLRADYGDKLPDPDLDQVLRASRRAYPSLVLASEELWIDLEKETLANMALSPEESQILASARRHDGAFPLFINGRAGSGKSTILQYLFADLLYQYSVNPQLHACAPPVYFTASGDLLRVARLFVERLLRSEAIFSVNEDAAKLVSGFADILKDAFREFYPHLLSLLPRDIRNERFKPENRIDYPRFRAMWHSRFSQERAAFRDYGPEISWHVIRSYIKGLSSETHLDADEYTQLPHNQITVTPEAYHVVYERVWQGWYQHTTEVHGLWDDQDLTRYLLDEDIPQPLYPAVFCDEAQDFTRIELELLLRLSLFSNRAIPPNDLSKIPFV